MGNVRGKCREKYRGEMSGCRLGFVERMTVDRIPQKTLNAKFEGTRIKSRPKLCWIDNEDLGLLEE